MKRFWTIRPDNDGERTYYGSVVAETKEQATLMFEVILRRKLNSPSYSFVSWHLKE